MEEETQSNEITHVLNSIEKSVAKLALESEELESRVIRIEQVIEVYTYGIKNFWERDWPTMMGEIRNISEKLTKQLDQQSQYKNELDLLKQKVDMSTAQVNEKMSELKRVSDEQRMALWKVIATGLGSGAIIPTLLEAAQRL